MQYFPNATKKFPNQMLRNIPRMDFKANFASRVYHRYRFTCGIQHAGITGAGMGLNICTCGNTIPVHMVLQVVTGLSCNRYHQVL